MTWPQSFDAAEYDGQDFPEWGSRRPTMPAYDDRVPTLHPRATTLNDKGSTEAP